MNAFLIFTLYKIVRNTNILIIHKKWFLCVITVKYVQNEGRNYGNTLKNKN